MNQEAAHPALRSSANGRPVKSKLPHFLRDGRGLIRLISSIVLMGKFQTDFKFAFLAEIETGIRLGGKLWLDYDVALAQVTPFGACYLSFNGLYISSKVFHSN